VNSHEYWICGLFEERIRAQKHARSETFKSDVSAIPPRRRRLTDCKQKETKSTKAAFDHQADTAQRLTFFDHPTNITDLPKQSAG
jgi:hypothetical protein